jgi:hypothetical protein
LPKNKGISAEDGRVRILLLLAGPVTINFFGPTKVYAYCDGLDGPGGIPAFVSLLTRLLDA